MAHISIDKQIRQAASRNELKRMLATRSYLPSEYSRTNDYTNMTQIGKGQCGKIHTLNGEMVIKLPNAPIKLEELFQDARIHLLVEEAFKGVRNINIPSFHAWVSPSTQPFWEDIGSPLVEDVTIPNYGLVSERIHSIQLSVREALVDAFFSETTVQKSAILEEPENRDCLVRLYLGRRTAGNRDSKKVSLRNFPFCMDEMESLGLDTGRYAEVMAHALAVMHWKAGIDANDVEFVLGSAPLVGKHPSALTLAKHDIDSAAQLYEPDLKRRSIAIWLLDFNQCSKFEHDSAGLKKLVDGFWWNDPYYPRPNSDNTNDQNLWKVFVQTYRHISAGLTESKLPELFINAVEERGRRRTPGNLFN